MKQKKQLPISVIMAVYNGEKYLEATLRSIISQSVHPKELLIINDGSTDATETILKKYTQLHSFISYENQANQGQAKTRNQLFSKASEKYIAICDGDDLMLPWWLESQYDFMENHLGVTVSSGLYIPFGGGLFGSMKNLIYSWMNRYRLPMNPFYYQKINSLSLELFFHNVITNPSTFIRKNVLSNYQYNPNSSCEDYHFFSDISLKHKIEKRSIPFLLYRQHVNQTSQTKKDAITQDIIEVSKKIKSHYGWSFNEDIITYFKKGFDSMNIQKMETILKDVPKMKAQLQETFPSENIQDIVNFFIWKSTRHYIRKNPIPKKEVKLLLKKHLPSKNFKEKTRTLFL